MNESTFRSLFHRAIGDPEVPSYLSSQARQALNRSLERHPSRSHSGLASLAAVVLAVAVVTVLLAPRLLTHRSSPVALPSPSASPPVTSPSPSPDPNACRLPIVIDNSIGLQDTLTAGFLDVESGQFSPDPNVSFEDLPHGPSRFKAGNVVVPDVYDPVVKRWLPSYLVSPDQLSYAYVTSTAASSELHAYDLVNHADRIVWVSDMSVDANRWKVDGIYTSTVPFNGGQMRYWKVNSNSGQATEIDQATFNPGKSLVSAPGSYGISGPDPETALYTVGSRNAGTRYTDFVILNGTRTDIYSGVVGDQMDFDPVNVWFDGPRLWFSNYDDKYLWSWTAQTGLTRHSVQIPGQPSGARVSLTYTIAGPCS